MSLGRSRTGGWGMQVMWRRNLQIGQKNPDQFVQFLTGVLEVSQQKAVQLFIWFGFENCKMLPLTYPLSRRDTKLSLRRTGLHVRSRRISRNSAGKISGITSSLQNHSPQSSMFT